MKNYSFIFFCSIAVIVCSLSCKNKTSEKNVASTVKFSKEGRFLIKQTFDTAGKLTSKQYFNNDTVHDGPSTEYFENGTVEKWKWFTPKAKYPKCVVYYDNKGSFDTIKGNPFIEVIIVRYTSTWVTIINPPNLRYVIILDDIFNNKSTAQYRYEPFSLDSMNCIILNKEGGYTQKSGHEYLLYLYVIDSTRGVLERQHNALEVTNDYSKPIYVDSKVLPIKLLEE